MIGGKYNGGRGTKPPGVVGTLVVGGLGKEIDGVPGLGGLGKVLLGGLGTITGGFGTDPGPPTGLGGGFSIGPIGAEDIGGGGGTKGVNPPPPPAGGAGGEGMVVAGGCGVNGGGYTQNGGPFSGRVIGGSES